MFSNRRFGWKMAGAVALVLGLGALSAAAGSRVKPAAWQCLAQPEKWDGREVWIPGARVLSVERDGFVLEANALPFRVAGRADVRPDEWVGVAGTFEAAGPRLRLRELRKPGPLGGTRWIVELVSLVVLAVVLLNFLRHFAFRPDLARVEGAE